MAWQRVRGAEAVSAPDNLAPPLIAVEPSSSSGDVSTAFWPHSTVAPAAIGIQVAVGWAHKPTPHYRTHLLTMMVMTQDPGDPDTAGTPTIPVTQAAGDSWDHSYTPPTMTADTQVAQVRENKNLCYSTT